jgi:hypothetical protein
MKVYVYGYRARTDEEIEAERRKLPPFTLIEPVIVSYHENPEWRIPLESEAVWRRDELQNALVHVGPHYCEFSIEELPEGDFAIVCAEHPELGQSNPGGPRRG